MNFPRRRFRTASTLALFLTALGIVSISSAAAPTAGQPAPDFTLPSQAGKEVGLKDLRGQWVVLYFYPKDFTGGCTMEAKNFQRDLAKYEAAKATIVGVSVDTAESHKSFCEKEGLNFTLLSDVGGKVSEAYGSVMDREGVKYSARNTFLISPDGTVARTFMKVSPAGHSEEVLKAIAELQAH